MFHQSLASLAWGGRRGRCAATLRARAASAVALLALAVACAGEAPPASGAAAARAVVHAGIPAALEAASQDGALALLVFGAEWCAKCKELGETLDAREFREKSGLLHLVRIDIDADRDNTRLYRVSAVPALFLVTAEMKIVAAAVGAKTAPELLAWIEAGRARVARGTWEGTAAGEGAEVPDAATASAEDFRAMAALLGERDPVGRGRAVAFFLAAREEGVPYLIEGLGDAYLGVRVGASEVVARLAPTAPAIDPWAEAGARAVALDAFKSWWRDAGKLPPAAAAELTAAETRSVKDALAALLSQDPFRRTEAMALLVRLGGPVLPELRAAWERAVSRGDQKLLWVLDDVRWAVLVPDALEGELKVRRVLARGASEERQAAVDRLGGAGKRALAALSELVGDADPMVCERVTYALTRIKSVDALAALGVLLGAKNGNLRMVAAQQLGRTKDERAAQYLLAAVQDPDESVATVAIAALQEVKAKNAGPALEKCLGDARWRVRAAAAEAIGDLSIGTAAAALYELLNDEDAFVVRSAVEALVSLGHGPSEEDFARLRTLIATTPELAHAITRLVLRGGEGLTRVEILFDEADEARRCTILKALAETSTRSESGDAAWQPLVEKALNVPQVAVRRGAMAVVGNRSIKLRFDTVEKGLVDADAQVRALAAGQALLVASFYLGVNASDIPSYGDDYGLLAKYAALPEEAKAPKPAPTPAEVAEAAAKEAAAKEAAAKAARESAARSRAGPLARIIRGLVGGPSVASSSYRIEDGNESPPKIVARATPVRERLARWHEVIGARLTETSDVREVIAYCVTGDGASDLPRLEATFARGDLAVGHAGREDHVWAVLLKCLPWPAGKEALERACASPRLYARMLPEARYAHPEAAALLRDPARVTEAVERMTGEELEQVVGHVAGWRIKREHAPVSDGASSVTDEHDGEVLSVMSSSGDEWGEENPKDVEQVSARLCASAVPRARALGVFLAGASASVDLRAEVLKGLRSDNEWIIRAAIQSASRWSATPAERETRFAPFLSDSRQEVARAACIALLDPALHYCSDVDDFNERFAFEDVWAWVGGYSTLSSDDEGNYVAKPVADKPAFLPEAHAQLASHAAAGHARVLPVLAMLLAQYGDMSGLEQQLELWERGSRESVPDLLLYALAATGDARYLAPFKAEIESTGYEYTLRSLRNWLPRMEEQLAAQLKAAISKRYEELGLKER